MTSPNPRLQVLEDDPLPHEQPRQWHGPAKTGVAGVYNRALYLRERRKALNAGAD